jgi:hypothetical protein
MTLQSYTEIKKELFKQGNRLTRFWRIMLYAWFYPWYLWQVIKIKYENKTR